jgi:hypothetical protein
MGGMLVLGKIGLGPGVYMSVPGISRKKGRSGGMREEKEDWGKGVDERCWLALRAMMGEDEWMGKPWSPGLHFCRLGMVSIRQTTRGQVTGVVTPECSGRSRGADRIGRRGCWLLALRKWLRFLVPAAFGLVPELVLAEHWSGIRARESTCLLSAPAEAFVITVSFLVAIMNDPE